MLASLRDIAIIILAIAAILDLLVILIIAVLLYKKLSPVLDSAKVTTNNIRGTTAFMSDTMVKPLIGVIGFAIGLRRTLSVLTGLGKRKGGR